MQKNIFKKSVIHSPIQQKNFKLKHQSFEIWHGYFGTASRQKDVSDLKKLLNSQSTWTKCD